MNFVIFLAALLLSYAAGRTSHVLAHRWHIQSIHHWVHGMVGVIIGLIGYKFWWGFPLALLGLGLVISDLGDMLKLRFFGVEKFEKKKFWGID